ncbi:hypothetical protein PENFLA_c086G04092 [Penicillium flavigenum]|uniref:Uncharacterized protein n=1 Tax=Penicillium flavigenum TaxID=254877 RepID=A0A1V6S995_9EURO|nr:hypothetical protein PENFLA_c086G04092 [Penicillium flavigenum]
MRETTALGAAIAAGLAFGLWGNFTELRNINQSKAHITRDRSASKFFEWEKAVRMSKGCGGTNLKNAREIVSKNEKPLNGASVKLKTSLDVRQSQSFSSDVIATTGSTPTERPQVRNGLFEIPPAKTPLFSVFGDLDDADEEDLLLELRKVEILQKLKNIRKLKLSYY